jgi:hypothetical protein
MSAVLQFPLQTDVERAWRVLNVNLSRYERQFGRNAPGSDERLEAAFEALRAALPNEPEIEAEFHCAGKWHPITVVGETDKFYRIRSRDGRFVNFGGRYVLAGQTLCVRKSAVRFDGDADDDDQVLRTHGDQR